MTDIIDAIYRKYKWVRPILGVVFFLISPVYLPVCLIIREWDDVCDYYAQCVDALMGRDL